MNIIASIGQNPDFIAFMAHSGFAYFAVHHGLPWWIAVPTAALKEFWFDPRFETNQKIWPDGALDFAGYGVGIALGLLW